MMRAGAAGTPLREAIGQIMDDRDGQQSLPAWEALYGPNVGYAIELYERFLSDPESVDPESRAVFQRLGRDEDRAIATLTRPASHTVVNGNGNGASVSQSPPLPQTNGSTATATTPISPRAVDVS